MNDQAKLITLRRRYAAETRRRIARTITHLSAIQSDPGGDLSHVLRQVRDQEAASGRAGFERVARLCQSMQDFLREVRCDEPPRPGAHVTVLMEVCRAIQMHADAVGATTPRS